MIPAVGTLEYTIWRAGRPNPAPPRAQRPDPYDRLAMRLFRRGLDTVAIGHRLGVSEAEAEHLLHRARERGRRT